MIDPTKLPTELRRDISIWLAFNAGVKVTFWLIAAGLLLGLIYAVVAGWALDHGVLVLL